VSLISFIGIIHDHHVTLVHNLHGLVVRVRRVIALARDARSQRILRSLPLLL
jgi:hypothetical protein